MFQIGAPEPNRSGPRQTEVALDWLPANECNDAGIRVLISSACKPRPEDALLRPWQNDPGIHPESKGRRFVMAHRRPSPILLLILGAAVLAVGIVSPVLAGAAVSQSSSNKGSIDACVVLPGFATPPASFSLHTTGPKSFDKTADFQASDCRSYNPVQSGQYTVVQSDTAPGSHLAQIHCFIAGFANHQVGTVDLPSASVTIKVSQPTVCVFAEQPGGAGGPPAVGSSTKKSGTTTTSTSTTTTTTPKSTTPATICVQNPDYPPKLPAYFCTSNANRVG
jgi:hypothetical protein